MLKPLLPKTVQEAVSQAMYPPPPPPYRFSLSDTPRKPSPFPFMVSREDDVLSQLGAKYLPSKLNHNYLPYYWLHLRDIRYPAERILEIGLQTDHSIRMWEEFFPRATLYGMDIDPACKQFEGGRRRVFIGDQSDPTFLRSVVAQTGPLDVVIDDGSHKVEHQLTTFEYLFPTMSDHGIDVVEDVGGCVGDFALRTVNAFKALINHPMYWPSGYTPDKWRYLSSFHFGASWGDRNIISVAFYSWMVFIMRGRNPEDNPFFLKPGEIG